MDELAFILSLWENKRDFIFDTFTMFDSLYICPFNL